MTNATATTQHAKWMTPEQGQVVSEVLDGIMHIATLPEITLKIVKIVDDPKATPKQLNDVITHDPALCARILKVVNSAFYGLPGQVGSVNRAIVLLGLNAVKNIAIAASMSKLFSSTTQIGGFEPRDLWKHSIATAAAVKLIAEKTELNLVDEAFLAGLIHDIGIMVEFQSMPDKLAQVVQTRRDESITFLEAEQKVIGATHQQLGLGLCLTWQFPHAFAMITGFHHNPQQLDPEIRPLTSAVHVGDILAAQMKIGLTSTVCTDELDQDILDELKLTNSMIENIKENLPEAYDVAEQLLN